LLFVQLEYICSINIIYNYHKKREKILKSGKKRKTMIC